MAAVFEIFFLSRFYLHIFSAYANNREA